MNPLLELAESLAALALLYLVAKAWAAIRAWVIRRGWHRYFERARADFAKTVQVAPAGRDAGDGVAVSGPEPGRYEQVGGLQ